MSEEPSEEEVLEEEEEEPEVLLAEKRYDEIDEILSKTMKVDKKREWSINDMLDVVFLNKTLGIPVFVALMWAVFQLVFTFGAPFQDVIANFFGWIGTLAEVGLPQYPIVANFISAAICNGVGTVMSFIPIIFLLFLVLAMLEDCGYMSRAAFVMDRAMYKLGLHGKSFIPLICGFGCNIPGIMACRTIGSEKDRNLTILVDPLISCGARMVIYMYIAGAIFPAAMVGTAVFSIVILGVVLAVAMAVLFRHTLFKGKPSAFMMELPRYAIPTAKASILHMWERGKWFIYKAGTIIFGITIIVWFLEVLPWGPTQGGTVIENSYIAMIGHFLQPSVEIFGWDWKTAVALFFGFMAKETVVATMETLGQTAEVLPSVLTPLSAYALLAFSLIYVPCVACMATIWREMSLKWMLFAIAYLMILAGLISLVIIGIGHFLLGMPIHV
jgi:ferrous iron transport protein B